MWELCSVNVKCPGVADYTEWTGIQNKKVGVKENGATEQERKMLRGPRCWIITANYLKLKLSTKWDACIALHCSTG